MNPGSLKAFLLPFIKSAASFEQAPVLAALHKLMAAGAVI